jgi:hypothetical protein
MFRPPSLVPLLLVLGTACSPGTPALPDALSTCATPECRTAWVTERWPQDAPSTAMAVVATGDPVVQLSLVLTLAEAFPGEVGELCTLLPIGDPRKRCEQTNARPHLQASAQPAEKIYRQAWSHAFGPLEVLKLPALGMDLEPLPVECEPGLTAIACHSTAAKKAARRGRGVDAVRHCMALPEGKWADECIFGAAEIMAMPGQHTAFSQARFAEGARMCTLARDFMPNCLTHLNERLERHAPAANLSDLAAWRQWATLITGIGEGADQVPSAHMAWFTARVWSGVIAAAVEATANPSPKLVTALDPAHQTFLWDALIWRALDGEGGGFQKRHTLTGWVELAGGPTSAGIASASLGHLGADGRTYVPHMGQWWRERHPQLAIDLQISVLEAASQLLPEEEVSVLCREASTSGDPLLQRTAHRLRIRLKRGISTRDGPMEQRNRSGSPSAPGGTAP